MLRSVYGTCTVWTPSRFRLSVPCWSAYAVDQTSSMALIACDECGGQVSDKAPACPKCGAPVTPPVASRSPAYSPARELEKLLARRSPSHTGTSTWIKAGGCIFVLLVVAAALDLQSSRYHETQPDQRQVDRIDAWLACREFVTRRLKAPSTASFPFAGSQDYVADLGEGRFRASAYVDAQNSFGAKIRTTFDCTVKCVADRCTPESLKLAE
jgi:hypothetical protein